MTHEERDELLIRVDERTARLETWAADHREHHRKIFHTCIGAVVSMLLTGATAVLSLIVALIKSDGR